MNMGNNIQRRYFTGNPPKKFKWFFPILRTYGWYHWFHHTDNGQLTYIIGTVVGIMGFMYLMWVVMSIVFLIDPGNPYNI